MISTAFWRTYRPRELRSIPGARTTTTDDVDGLRTQKETGSNFGSRQHKVMLTRCRAMAFWRGETGQRIMGKCLFTEIVRRGTAQVVAQLTVQFTARFTEKSVAALRIAKRALRVSEEETFGAGLDETERIYLQDLMKTYDAEEGIRAFLERRQPKWEDR